MTVEERTFSAWIHMKDDVVMRKTHPVFRKVIGIACEHKVATVSTELVSG